MKEINKQCMALAFVFYFLNWDYCCSTFIDDVTITYGYVADDYGSWIFELPKSFMERGDGL